MIIFSPEIIVMKQTYKPAGKHREHFYRKMVQDLKAKNGLLILQNVLFK